LFLLLLIDLLLIELLLIGFLLIRFLLIGFLAAGSLPLLIQPEPHQALVCFAIFSLRLSLFAYLFSLISFRLSVCT